MKAFRQRIDVQPAFIAFLCAYYYFDPARTFFPFLFSVTVHEAAHLLLLRLFRARIHKLRLSGFGAVIITEPLSYPQELLTAAAGPAANLGLLLLTLRRDPALALVNLCLFAYNMLPLYPLDGGRLLRAGLRLLLPERAAMLAEHIIALLCLSGLCACAVYLTCVWHAGLWPVLVFGLLLVRISGTIFSGKRNLPICG